MSGPLRIGLGILLVLVGALWTLQGLGVVGGSVMSGVTLWAIIGPLVVLAGIALVVTGRRRRHHPLTTPSPTVTPGSTDPLGPCSRVRSGRSASGRPGLPGVGELG